uniref:Venom polypeptide n=1 Tax=Dolopus genitalis TaxID=2488630 RepID=A0A3G5BIJ0_DOLGE|nr:venom polypeptide [Dolopus genitalis]
MKSILLVFLFLAAAVAIPLENKNNPLGIQPRITGGQNAQPNQFPYQVGLKLTKFIKGLPFSAWCGGSLISNKVVLTAAHCLLNSNGGMIYLGAHNRSKPTENGRAMVKVWKSNYILHENYDDFLHTDDIALIVLPQKVQLTDKIKVINMPQSSKFDVTGRIAIVSGWGRTGDRKNSTTNILRFADQRIMPDDYCMKPYGIILPSQICVDTSNGKSACQGDSGGPLAIEDSKGSNTVVGLTSYGKVYGCEKGYPVIFTRVSFYLNWIHEKTGIPVQ